MLKLIITFPHMEAEIAKSVAKLPPLGEKVDWAKFDADREKHIEIFSAWRKIEDKAMATLEEAAFALAMERVRRKSGRAGYYSDHIGLSPLYSVDKRGFEIVADLLYPELIVALEDLQKLGSFEMHFENECGEEVPADWWHDEELSLYEPFAVSNYDFDEKLAEVSVTPQLPTLYENCTGEPA